MSSAPCELPGSQRAASTILFVLAPDGVYLAAASPRHWCALTAPFHPYRPRASCEAPSGGSARLRLLAAGPLLTDRLPGCEPRPHDLGGYFLWHFPSAFAASGYDPRPSLLCGVRTFLESRLHRRCGRIRRSGLATPAAVWPAETDKVILPPEISRCAGMQARFSSK